MPQRPGSPFRSTLLSLAFLAGGWALAEAPPVVVGPRVCATYAEAFSVHGVAGDEVLLFALQPSAVPGHAAGVWVNRRADGAAVGCFDPPPGGWGAPVAAKLIQHESPTGTGTSGSLLILDAFTPADAGLRPAVLHVYAYAYDPAAGLTSRRVRSTALPSFTGPDAQGLPTGPLYPLNVALLPDGRAVITDMILGALWVASASLDDWRLAFIDPALGLGELKAPISGIGRAPGGGTRPYAFSTAPFPPAYPFPVLPGIRGVTYCAPTDEIAVIRTATPGGIFGIPARVLFDPGLPPTAKHWALRPIAPPLPGVTDLAVGLDHDRFHPGSPWVYWQRGPANAQEGYNTLYRVHLVTGAIQRVAESLTCYDWANEISVLPTRGASPFTDLATANMQDHNSADSNALLNGTHDLVGPTLVPIVRVSPW